MFTVFLYYCFLVVSLHIFWGNELLCVPRKKTIHFYLWNLELVNLNVLMISFRVYEIPRKLLNSFL